MQTKICIKLNLLVNKSRFPLAPARSHASSTTAVKLTCSPSFSFSMLFHSDDILTVKLVPPDCCVPFKIMVTFSHCKIFASYCNFNVFARHFTSHSPSPWINVAKVIHPQIIFHSRSPLTRPTPIRNLYSERIRSPSYLQSKSFSDVHPSSQRHKKNISLLSVEILKGNLHANVHMGISLFKFFTWHVAQFPYIRSWSWWQ